MWLGSAASARRRGSRVEPPVAGILDIGGDVRPDRLSVGIATTLFPGDRGPRAGHVSPDALADSYRVLQRAVARLCLSAGFTVVRRFDGPGHEFQELVRARRCLARARSGVAVASVTGVHRCSRCTHDAPPKRREVSGANVAGRSVLPGPSWSGAARALTDWVRVFAQRQRQLGGSPRVCVGGEVVQRARCSLGSRLRHQSGLGGISARYNGIQSCVGFA